MKTSRIIACAAIAMALTACGSDKDKAVKGLEDYKDSKVFQGANLSKSNYANGKTRLATDWIGPEADIGKKEKRSIAARKFLPLTKPGSTFHTAFPVDKLYLEDSMNEDKLSSKYVNDPDSIDEVFKLGLSRKTILAHKGVANYHLKTGVLNLPYSMVMGATLEDRDLLDKIATDFGGAGNFRVYSVSGLATPVENVERLVKKSGQKFKYYGVAYTGEERGALTYTIDFAKATGQGKIEGLKTFDDKKGRIPDGVINLKEADLASGSDLKPMANGKSMYYIKGSTDLPMNNRYFLGLYGPNAEEIAGMIVKDGVEDMVSTKFLAGGESAGVIGMSGTVSNQLYKKIADD